MKILYILLCITYVTCYTVDVSSSIKEKIVGGKYIPIKDARHHAGLYYYGTLFCSAAIIARNWLLSAEKCFIDKLSEWDSVKVKVGTNHNEGDPAESSDPFINVAAIEKYSNDFPGSDVNTNLLLILLEGLIALSRNQNPVPISNSAIEPLPKKEMTITGFGKDQLDNQGPSLWLKKTTVKVLDHSDCPVDFSRLFCASDFNSDASQFDDGGGGIVDGKLVAIITGMPKGVPGSVGIYTKVGAFHSWIVRHTKLAL